MAVSATPTLDQTDAAMQAITAALADPTLPDALQTALENMSNFLQDIQDHLIEQSEQAWVSALSAANDQLQAIAKALNAEVAKLAAETATIQKVSDIVGTLVGIVGGLVSGGII